MLLTRNTLDSIGSGAHHRQGVEPCQASPGHPESRRRRPPDARRPHRRRRTQTRQGILRSSPGGWESAAVTVKQRPRIREPLPGSPTPNAVRRLRYSGQSRARGSLPDIFRWSEAWFGMRVIPAVERGATNSNRKSCPINKLIDCIALATHTTSLRCHPRAFAFEPCQS